MKTMILAASLAALGIAAQASAEATTADFDTRCAMILSASSGQADTKQAADVRMASFYYLGRVDSRVPAVNFEASAKRLAPSLADPKAVTKYGSECMALLGRRIATLKVATGAPAAKKPAPKK